MRPRDPAVLAAPERHARALIFAWLLSLPASADPADQAAALANRLAAAPDHPLLPHLLDLLLEFQAPTRRMPRRLM